MSAKRLFDRIADLRRPCLGLTALAFAFSPLAATAAETCKPTSDEKSVFMRSLQTDLMVAALTCSTSDQYNTFIHQFQSVLKTDADHLRGYYKKRRGKAGAEELNTFVTHLANDESERSIQQGQSAYCDNAAKLFQTVLATPAAKVEDYSTTLPLSGEAPVRKCALPAVAAATPVSTASAPVPAATDGSTPAEAPASSN